MTVIAPSEAQPGDLVLAHGRGIYARLIRIGEALDSTPANRHWNHAAIVVEAGTDPLVVQMGRVCELVHLSDVAPGGSVQLRTCPRGVDRRKAVRYARRRLGTRYSVLTIVCIAINLVTPKRLRVDFRRSPALICSALVARAYEHGGWDIGDQDPFTITPAQLAEMTTDSEVTP